VGVLVTQAAPPWHARAAGKGDGLPAAHGVEGRVDALLSMMSMWGTGGEASPCDWLIAGHMVCLTTCEKEWLQ
jgi:hypothetical protein